jgi:hypothetical protein
MPVKQGHAEKRQAEDHKFHGSTSSGLKDEAWVRAHRNHSQVKTANSGNRITPDHSM